MLERARARAGDEPVLFVAGDAHRLPFEAGTFDAARTERTLQHLADPTAAVRELVRVTRAGGMVMASEPDWGAAAMTGAPQRLVRALLKAAEAKIRNPWIGRELAGLFVDAGVLEIEVGAEALVLRDFDTIRAMTDLPTLIAELRADGEQKANDLEAEIEADAKAGRAVAAITLFTVTGRVA
jgi:SAM-dependent methyltransferase